MRAKKWMQAHNVKHVCYQMQYLMLHQQDDVPSAVRTCVHADKDMTVRCLLLLHLCWQYC